MGRLRLSDEDLDLALDEGLDPLAVAHSKRFRRVSNRYAHVVAEVYGGDLSRAMADSDEQVAATVAEWERSQGLPVRDWRAVGASEGREEPSSR